MSNPTHLLIKIEDIPDEVYMDCYYKSIPLNLSESEIKKLVNEYAEKYYPLDEYLKIEEEPQQTTFAVGRMAVQMAVNTVLKDLLKKKN